MAKLDHGSLWPCDEWDENKLSPGERTQIEHAQSEPRVGSFNDMLAALRSNQFSLRPSDLKRDRPKTAHGRIAQQAEAIVRLVHKGWVSEVAGYQRLQTLAMQQSRIGQQTLEALDKQITAVTRSERSDRAKPLLRMRKRRREQRRRTRRVNDELTDRCGLLFGGIGRKGRVERCDIRPHGLVVPSATKRKRVHWLLSTDNDASGKVISGVVVGSAHPHASGAVYRVSTAWVGGFNGGVCLNVTFGRGDRKYYDGF